MIQGQTLICLTLFVTIIDHILFIFITIMYFLQRTFAFYL
jgi:hypothetical protein